jgi:elongation factor G
MSARYSVANIGAACNRAIIMEKPVAPWPLLQIAIEPKSRADEAKLRAALSRLADEDPDFRVAWDEESGQTIISGGTEHHLDLIVHRLLHEFEIGVNVGAPQVAYRETITHAREQDCSHKRVFAGQGQFARVKVLFEPNGHNPEFAFVSRISDGAVPDEYAAGVEKGLRTILVSGPFAGFPMIGVKATLVDGAYHDTDSSASAFEIAGRACFKEAAPKLGVQLLEPIMTVEVVTPEDYIRDIVGDLKNRRGKIENQESRGLDVVINALVPLANMFKLDDTLRARSKGRAGLSVSYAGYAPVPMPPDGPGPSAAMAIA